MSAFIIVVHLSPSDEGGADGDHGEADVHVAREVMARGARLRVDVHVNPSPSHAWQKENDNMNLATIALCLSLALALFSSANAFSLLQLSSLSRPSLLHSRLYYIDTDERLEHVAAKPKVEPFHQIEQNDGVLNIEELTNGLAATLKEELTQDDVEELMALLETNLLELSAQVQLMTSES